jgi:hypothetical protein
MALPLLALLLLGYSGCTVITSRMEAQLTQGLIEHTDRWY